MPRLPARSVPSASFTTGYSVWMLDVRTIQRRRDRPVRSTKLRLSLSVTATGDVAMPVHRSKRPSCSAARITEEWVP